MIKKKCLPCSKTVALKLNYFYWKQKVINLLAGTITFLLYWHLCQAYILLHRKLQWGQSRLHNSKLSYVKPPFWNNGTIHHLYRLGLYSQIGEQPSYRFLVSTHVLIIYSLTYNVKYCHTIFAKFCNSLIKINWQNLENALL